MRIEDGDWLGTDCMDTERLRESTSPQVRTMALVNECHVGHNNSRLVDIVAGFEQRLVRYAAHITGDIERARDVVQETFLRLCREPDVAATDYLAQWLFTVCRRLALDVRRKEARMNLATDEQAQRPEKRGRPGDALESAEQVQQVLTTLARLPANQQEVVRLKFQEGMSYKAIAAVTGLSVSNVGYLLHVAIRGLQQQLSTRE